MEITSFLSELGISLGDLENPIEAEKLLMMLDSPAKMEAMGINLGQRRRMMEWLTKRMPKASKTTLLNSYAQARQWTFPNAAIPQAPKPLSQVNPTRTPLFIPGVGLQYTSPQNQNPPSGKPVHFPMAQTSMSSPHRRQSNASPTYLDENGRYREDNDVDSHEYPHATFDPRFNVSTPSHSTSMDPEYYRTDDWMKSPPTATVNHAQLTSDDNVDVNFQSAANHQSFSIAHGLRANGFPENSSSDAQMSFAQRTEQKATTQNANSSEYISRLLASHDRLQHDNRILEQLLLENQKTAQMLAQDLRIVKESLRSEMEHQARQVAEYKRTQMSAEKVNVHKKNLLITRHVVDVQEMRYLRQELDVARAKLYQARKEADTAIAATAVAAGRIPSHSPLSPPGFGPDAGGHGHLGPLAFAPSSLPLIDSSMKGMDGSPSSTFDSAHTAQSSFEFGFGSPNGGSSSSSSSITDFDGTSSSPQTHTSVPPVDPLVSFLPDPFGGTSQENLPPKKASPSVLGQTSSMHLESFSMHDLVQITDTTTAEVGTANVVGVGVGVASSLNQAVELNHSDFTVSFQMIAKQCNKEIDTPTGMGTLHHLYAMDSDHMAAERERLAAAYRKDNGDDDTDEKGEYIALQNALQQQAEVEALIKIFSDFVTSSGGCIPGSQLGEFYKMNPQADLKRRLKAAGGLQTICTNSEGRLACDDSGIKAGKLWLFIPTADGGMPSVKGGNSNQSGVSTSRSGQKQMQGMTEAQPNATSTAARGSGSAKDVGVVKPSSKGATSGSSVNKPSSEDSRSVAQVGNTNGTLVRSNGPVGSNSKAAGGRDVKVAPASTSSARSNDRDGRRDCKSGSKGFEAGAAFSFAGAELRRGRGISTGSSTPSDSNARKSTNSTTKSGREAEK